MNPRIRERRNEMLPRWRTMVESLFPVSIPKFARWTELEDIVEVLNQIGKQCNNRNHMFFPSGGGLDLTGAKLSVVEKGCVELHTKGLTYLVKPKELIFFSVDKDPGWMGFRLDLNTLQPSGVYEEYFEDTIREEVTEVLPGVYEQRAVWDDGYYIYTDSDREERLRANARVVTRFLHGSLVIFSKGSWYNLVRTKSFDAYNAIHNKFSAEEFYEFIKDTAKTIHV